MGICKSPRGRLSGTHHRGSLEHDAITPSSRDGLHTNHPNIKACDADPIGYTSQILWKYRLGRDCFQMKNLQQLALCEQKRGNGVLQNIITQGLGGAMVHFRNAMVYCLKHLSTPCSLWNLLECYSHLNVACRCSALQIVPRYTEWFFLYIFTGTLLFRIFQSLSDWPCLQLWRKILEKSEDSFSHVIFLSHKKKKTIESVGLKEKVQYHSGVAHLPSWNTC